MALWAQWFVICLALTVGLASVDGISLRQGSGNPRFARTILVGMLNMVFLFAILAYVDRSPLPQAAGAILALSAVVASYWLVVRPRLT